jgi:hypothetical protein
LRWGDSCWTRNPSYLIKLFYTDSEFIIVFHP